LPEEIRHFEQKKFECVPSRAAVNLPSVFFTSSLTSFISFRIEVWPSSADITLVDLKDRGVKLQIARRDDQTIAPGETKRVFIGRRDLVDITGTADGEVTLNGHPATPVENVAEQRYPNEPADLRSP